VTLPTPLDLIVVPIARVVGGVSVTDDIIIEKQGSHQVGITFKKVAPTTETYKWQILNLKNPPSTKPSAPFVNLVVLSAASSQVQTF